ncbi:hypothetical protein EYZ11_008252 [Aspergillus tanneri]|uniref:Uncharacterized protein n=1 Tax=Aspergillus tanneri TaxID=1220188 RepID=A0A4S3JB41_9EURO|nr:uncharacterized protein ATNIH1004_009807 [Aspergillus tanneri]KAA8643045.1 hypothetical protein ATNIH1004_009807 [Aspergillus tanneri]THC92270.1 hypothetical protein EYZ11_008252 [Aspergillus tanneri]
MAGDDDQNQHHHNNTARVWPDDDNPFDAFRRFADEQVASMLQSVVGLPSMVNPPSSGQWSVFTDDPCYARDSNYRQRQNDDATGNGEQPSGSGAANDAANNPPCRSENHWRTHRFRRHEVSDIDSFVDSFFDKFWFDDRFSRFFHPYQRPMFSSVIRDEPHAWPVTYLMFSPYSPLHLERQAQYRSHRDRGLFSSLMSSLKPSSDSDQSEPQWREAFEDLLRLENGKPVLDRSPTDISKQESGKEWLQGLVKRGSLGDRWAYVPGTDGRSWSTIMFGGSSSKEDDHKQLENEDLDNNVKAEFSWDFKEPESVTELDIYDRFLNDIEARGREFFRARDSPLLRLLLEDRQGAKDNHTPSQIESRHEDTDNWLELVSGGQTNPVPDTAPATEQSTSNQSAIVETSTAEQQPYVISKKSTTQRVRLADGSIQTKTIKTKRFSDGYEESNESVEVVNPSQHNRVPADQENEPAPDQNKSGWFWKGN